MNIVLLAVAVFGMLAAAIWWATWVVESLGGFQMPWYGWLAMAGGVIFTLGVGFGLMGLVFYSSRRGYDEAVHQARWEHDDNERR